MVASEAIAVTLERAAAAVAASGEGLVSVRQTQLLPEDRDTQALAFTGPRGDTYLHLAPGPKGYFVNGDDLAKGLFFWGWIADPAEALCVAIDGAKHGEAALATLDCEV